MQASSEWSCVENFQRQPLTLDVTAQHKTPNSICESDLKQIKNKMLKP